MTDKETTFLRAALWVDEDFDLKWSIHLASWVPISVTAADVAGLLGKLIDELGVAKATFEREAGVDPRGAVPPVLAFVRPEAGEEDDDG